MKNGISLIALVITIVVLIILTGVVIISSVGGNGIIDNTQITVDKYNKNVIIEEIKTKIQTKRLKKANQGVYILSMQEIIPIIEDYGIFDNNILELTTNTNNGKKEMKIWLYEIMNIPLEEYATIIYENNKLEVETELTNNGYIVEYSTNGGKNWNKYVSIVTIEEESGIYVRLTNQEGRVVSNVIYITTEGSEIIDDTRPTVEIFADTTDITNVDRIKYTIRFSEPVLGFKMESIQVLNGIKGTFEKQNAMEYTIVVSNSEDCIQTLIVPANICIDMSGNKNEEAKKEININRTVPVVTITPNGGSGINSVEVTITASGVNQLRQDNEYKYCLSKNQTPQEDEQWQEYISEQSFRIGTNLDGIYYVHIKQIYDIAGNYSDSVTSNQFVFDNTKPSIDLSINSNSTASKNQSTTIQIDDINNVTYMYGWSTSGTIAPSSWTNGTSKSQLVTKDTVTGNYYLWIKDLYDVAGNSGVTSTVGGITTINKISGAFFVDNQGPNNFTPTVANVTQTSIQISASTTDNNGQSVRYEYSINNGGSWQNSNTFTGLTAGTTYNQIKVKAIDSLGNTYTSGSITATTSGQVNLLYAKGSIGEYVNYTGGGQSSWRIIWKQNNAVALVHTTTVGSYTFSTSNSGSGMNTYLNNFCASYLNSTYATTSRSIANTDIDLFTSQGGSLTSDLIIPTSISIYWLVNMSSPSTYGWFVRNWSGSCDIHRIDGGDYGSYEIRPVVELRSGIKITGGSGTSSSPWQISI